MNKYFLVIARYEGEKQEIFDNYISPINQRYCDKHGFDYVVIGNETSLDLVRDNPTWWKFTIVQDWIKTGKVKQGDVVTHFDADMVIVKDDKPYQTDKSFSYAIDNGNTHCMGNYTITVNTPNAWHGNLFFQTAGQPIKPVKIIESTGTEIFSQNWKQFRDHFRAFNMPMIGILIIIFRHSYFIISTVILSAFGRAISEVGAVMVVGGNIEHYTRVMTTAITLETRMGNLEYAMALGIVLILLTMFINSIVYLFNIKHR